MERENSTIAVYSDHHQVELAIKKLSELGFDMKKNVHYR